MGLRSKRRDRKAWKQDSYLPDLAAELAAEPKATAADIEPPRPAIRSVQALYGPDVRRCPNIGCGAPTTGDACVQCTAAGRLPADVDGYVPPGLEMILPDPPPGYPRSSFLTEAILDDDLLLADARVDAATPDELDRLALSVFGREDDLPTLDECGPGATVSVLYPGGDAA